MPEAIANLAPPRPPRAPSKASAKPEPAPARRGFEEELGRACAPADDSQPIPQAIESDAEAADEQPDEPVKPPKASSKKPPAVEQGITVAAQPQALTVSDEVITETTAEPPSPGATLPPLTVDAELDLPLEISGTEELTLPEDAAEMNISATIQLPPPTPESASISTTTPPPIPDSAPDTAAPIQATSPLTPAPDPARRGEASFSSGFEQPAPLDAATSPALPPEKDEPLAAPIEAIEDASAPLTAPAPSREPIVAEATEPAPGHADAPEPRFTDDNHPRIITALRSNLSHNGGSVTIRLDPPGLGEVQVSVELRDGMMIASIQTSTDDATRLMSHSLGQLKRSLESSGLAVEKLHVQQAPRDEQGGRAGDDRPGQQHHNDGRSAQQEQQRREILERVWRRLRGGRDPIDFVV